MSNMLIGYLFDNRLMIFTEDSTFLLICCHLWGILTKNIRPKISALTVRPRNKKSEFSPLCSLLSGLSIPHLHLEQLRYSFHTFIHEHLYFILSRLGTLNKCKYVLKYLRFVLRILGIHTIFIRCEGVIADNIAYQKFRKNLLFW